MRRPKLPTDRRHFTEAARAAAMASRLRKQQIAAPLDAPEVFIVRSTSASGPYAWEIRRFGGLVLDRSSGGFLDPGEARRAGERVLTSIGAAPSAPPLDREP